MTTIDDAIHDLRMAVQSRAYAESAFDRVTAKHARDEEQDAHTALRAAIEQYAAERVAESRKPLTEEQVFACDGIMAANMSAGLPMLVLMLLTRAIELAHGIGEKQNG